MDHEPEGEPPSFARGWKPYPISLIEEGFGTGVSIMAHDILAGIYCRCVLQVVRWAMRR